MVYLLEMPMSRPTYPEACARFQWADSLRALGWTPAGEVSLGETIIDRHPGSGRPALSWFGKDGSRRQYSFEELSRLSNRFANLLRAPGVRKGDRISGFLPLVPETLVTLLRAWKAGAVYVPIFTEELPKTETGKIQRFLLRDRSRRGVA